ncbi:hypothetical protein A5685_14775 [Mycobacterium colombiense]|uniref:Secreted protein n=1 Tax=Mycobacterium colombiense TaxID=339268 RepID=A0A1A2RKY6_9MYCO|nr:hypothetical protein [Mycobacterium colombiense]OBH52698.1 hypothetical protein A5685_14775 [Mycobacterium colombiense]
MHRVYFTLISLIAAIPAVVMAPAAHADDAVTYEVTSTAVSTANVEYSDASGRAALDNVQLPWRTNANVPNAHSGDTSVRADWHSSAKRFGWVTVRVYSRGSLLCEITLDVGDAECNGSGYRYTPVPPYQWCPPPLLSCGGTYRP